MFTGIVEECGTVTAVQKNAASAVLHIGCKKILSDIHLGDSIAVNGVCLTVTSFNGSSFSADVMHETLNRSSLGALSAGSRVNLERAMAAGGRFGGHIVSGHIDGTGTITQIQKDDNAVWYTINCGDQLLKYIIEKGSIAIDGISLTVARLEHRSFSVSILADKKSGDIVNLENDCIGKYVERLLSLEDPNAAPAKKESNITAAFLAEHGFNY